MLPKSLKVWLYLSLCKLLWAEPKHGRDRMCWVSWLLAVAQILLGRGQRTGCDYGPLWAAKQHLLHVLNRSSQLTELLDGQKENFYFQGSFHPGVSSIWIYKVAETAEEAVQKREPNSDTWVPNHSLHFLHSASSEYLVHNCFSAFSKWKLTTIRKWVIQIIHSWSEH